MSVLTARRGRLAPRRAASDPYGDAVRADSPVAWWRGNGTAADEIAGGTAGTLVGATYGTGFLPARPAAQTFNFDGVDDVVSIPSQTKTDITGSMTVEAWINPDVLSNPGFDSIVDRHNGWALETRDGRPELWLAAGVAATSPTVLVDGQTYHLVGTYDGTAVRMYVNGALVGSVTATATLAAGVTYIGAYASSDYFDGRIAEAALYNTALSAARIAAHYAAGSTA